MKKRFMMLGILLLSLLMVACSGKKEASEGKDAEQVLIFNLGAEPKTVDPQLNSATDGGIVINNTFEGLMRMNAEGMTVPATAESYEVSEDGTVYTFHIRENAKWSDGQPVKASDFEYAWKRALDPSVAAEYSFQLYYIKGAQEYFEGKASKDDVAIESIDDKTLEVTLVGPTPYFLALTTFYTYMPVREDIVAKKPEGWAKDTTIAVSNGPFVISEYEPSSRIVLLPNENYWNKENVKLDKIIFEEIVDQTTALTAYENGEVDVLREVPQQDIPRLQLEDSTFSIAPFLGTYYYIFNVDKEPTNNVNVRKALTYAIDRKSITEQVAKGGQLPATGFVPTGLFDSEGKDFRATGGDFGISVTADIAKAKEYLAKAGYPDGKGFPKITIIYNTSEGHKAIAEAIQEMWKKNLGIDVELMNQEWAVFQDTRHVGNFEIARAGWIGDYADPMTFLDMWTSYSGNNDAQWKWTTDKNKFASNKEYDSLIEKSKVTQGTERDALLYKAEKILMDEMITMPIYYYTGPIMVKEYVTGWERDILGTWYFGNTEIQK
ncbi:peptide ABC transporter substrate-binding protein [uncultured Ilyobacter sp.]|uniref:peptide ABC transporter substrate-binding protein n=1 Tax=uncultured Ilyobacter sp. TaxID=544433 RepID=UPI0029C63F03|nr:peptide ABC transporter substrate-binding protein [uncultured Ilyobacter sp.]